MGGLPRGLRSRLECHGTLASPGKRGSLRPICRKGSLSSRRIFPSPRKSDGTSQPVLLSSDPNRSFAPFRVAPRLFADRYLLFPRLFWVAGPSKVLSDGRFRFTRRGVRPRPSWRRRFVPGLLWCGHPQEARGGERDDRRDRREEGLRMAEHHVGQEPGDARGHRCLGDRPSGVAHALQGGPQGRPQRRSHVSRQDPSLAERPAHGYRTCFPVYGSGAPPVTPKVSPFT